MELGDKYLKEGKIDFARVEYQKAQKINNISEEIIKERLKKIELMYNEDKICINAGLEFERNGQFDEAINEFEKALKINPNSIKALEHLVMNLFIAGEYDKGIEKIKMLNSLSIENEITLYHKALYEYNKENYEKCAILIDKCLKVSTNFKNNALELKNKCLNKINVLNENRKNTAYQLFLKGTRLLINREFKMAIVSFYDSLSLSKPQIVGNISSEILLKKIPVVTTYSQLAIYFNLGIALEFLSKYDEAISIFECAYEVSPQNDVINFKIAELYLKLGNTNEAIKYYLNIEKVNPYFLNLYPKLAFCFKIIGNYEKSIEYFKKSIEYDSTNPINYYNLGIMYKKIGNYEKSIECFNKSLLLSNNDINFKYLVEDQINNLKLISNVNYQNNKM